jgi:hypothetical protein
MKALISEYDPDHANPPHSVKIGIRYIPINILRVWEVLLQVQNVQRFWKESEGLVKTWADDHSAHRVTIMAAQKQLLSCNWNTKVLGFSKSALSTVGGLMHHLTFSCLVTTDISYHMELLAKALEASNIRARLLSPLDIQYLTGCATQADRNGSVSYGCNRTCNNLRQLGSELSSGSASQFGGIMHINNNHWIAFLISPMESTIYLADSLHRQMGDSGLPVAAIGTLQWWLNESYSGLNKSTPTF